MTSQVELARNIATRAHTGQVDKAGKPYIGHLERVAARVHSEDAKAVAWLHDTIEDTDVTPRELADAGIAGHIIHAVLAITHQPNEPRIKYYERVQRVTLARQVKLADIADNSDPTRLACLDEATRTRLERKYAQAREILEQDPPMDMGWLSMKGAW